MIAGPAANRTASTIKQALISGLNQRGLDPYPVTHSNSNLDAGASAVQVILSAKETPTVIFCGSDLIAVGAMIALEAAGVDVPRDISIVGIDDIPFAFLTRPPLTTISVPREQLGVISFQALDKMSKLKRQRGAEYYLETELVIESLPPPRDSARPVASSCPANPFLRTQGKSGRERPTSHSISGDDGSFRASSHQASHC